MTKWILDCITVIGCVLIAFGITKFIETQYQSTYEIQCVLLVDGAEDSNQWLRRHPGWEVITISDINYGPPHMFVQREVIR